MKSFKTPKAYAVMADVIAIIFVFMLKPATDFMFRTGLNKCPAYQVGIICPGCGATRCVSNIAAGNFIEAFKYHPFVFGLFVYIGAVLVLLNLDYIFNIQIAKSIRKVITDYRVIVAVALCYVVFGFSRNFFEIFRLQLMYFA